MDTLRVAAGHVVDFQVLNMIIKQLFLKVTNIALVSFGLLVRNWDVVK